jgi:hypothetical protein
MSDVQRGEFEDVAYPFVDGIHANSRVVLPELGSRAMTRTLIGADTVDGVHPRTETHRRSRR